MQHVCGRGDVHTVFSWGNLRERDHLEIEIEVDGQMLKYLFKKSIGESGMYFSDSEYGQVACCFECGDEISVYRKCGKTPSLNFREGLG